jgi:hypothetical protein
LSVLVSPAAGTARAAIVQGDEPQPDACNPRLCHLGTRPHAHCGCGLPMPLRARMCDLCRCEGLKPRQLRRTRTIEDEEWDGRSYPSRRQRRCGTPHPDSHLRLLIAILAPVAENEKGTRA